MVASSTLSTHTSELKGAQNSVAVDLPLSCWPNEIPTSRPASRISIEVSVLRDEDRATLSYRSRTRWRRNEYSRVRTQIVLEMRAESTFGESEKELLRAFERGGFGARSSCAPLSRADEPFNFSDDRKRLLHRTFIYKASCRASSLIKLWPPLTLTVQFARCVIERIPLSRP